MTTVCVDPADFSTDSTGRLIIRTDCGIENGTSADPGLRVKYDSKDLTCSDTDGLGVKLGCGLTHSTSGIQARISNLHPVGGQESLADAVTRTAGNDVNVTHREDFDLTDWCTTNLGNLGVFQIGGSWDVDPQAQATFRVEVLYSLDGAAFQTSDVAYETFQFGELRRRQSFFGPLNVPNLTSGAHNIRVRMRVLNTSTPSGPNDSIVVHLLTAEIRGFVSSRNS